MNEKETKPEEAKNGPKTNERAQEKKQKRERNEAKRRMDGWKEKQKIRKKTD